MRICFLLLLAAVACAADPPVSIGLGPPPPSASTFVGVLPAANGGTGVNNTGTFTNASNTTITGGGTIALGGFTMTVPATDTVAMLAQSNTFTAATETISPAAGSSSLIIQAVTGSVSQVLFKNNGSNIGSIQETPTNPFTFNDAANSFNTLQYVAGSSSAGFWKVLNTTACTSVGTGCLVLSGGLGVGGELSVATANFNVTTSTANGAVASVLTASTGPTGASTTETGWITIKVAGTNHFIPYWDVGMHPTWSDAMAYCNGHPRTATLDQVEDEMAYVMDIR